MIDAKEAKRKSGVNKNITQRVFEILKKVDEVCGYGETKLEHDDSRNPLTATEVKFFKTLGFKIKKGEWERWEGSHGREHSSYKRTVISWD